MTERKTVEPHESPLGRYDPDTDEGLFEVQLLNVPLHLMVLGREHHDEVMREFAVLALDSVRAATMLICWVGSVYAWSRVDGRVLHGAALVMLIFLGAVAGPFYILVTARRWSPRLEGGAPAGVAGHRP